MWVIYSVSWVNLFCSPELNNTSLYNLRRIFFLFHNPKLQKKDIFDIYCIKDGFFLF